MSDARLARLVRDWARCHRAVERVKCGATCTETLDRDLEAAERALLRAADEIDRAGRQAPN